MSLESGKQPLETWSHGTLANLLASQGLALHISYDMIE